MIKENSANKAANFSPVSQVKVHVRVNYKFTSIYSGPSKYVILLGVNAKLD